MVNLSKYGKKYPYLIWDIWHFFADVSIKSMLAERLENQGVHPDLYFKCSMDFSEKYKNTYHEISERDGNGLIQPRTISKICDILCKNGMMSKVLIGGFNGFDGDTKFYKASSQKTKGSILGDKEFFARYLNNIVYGFPYIYESNTKNVRPVWVKKEDQIYNGTCFDTVVGIVTAKHCIDNCDEIQIDGIRAEILKSARVLASDSIDLMVIQQQNSYNWGDKFSMGDGEILDEIMVMGYPNHCGFDRFLTATTGAIAAIEESYLI